MNLTIDSKENESDGAIQPEYKNKATTIATIAIRAEPHTTIIIAMLKVRKKNKLRTNKKI